MKEGDFIKLDFDAFVKETDQLVDTTHEKVAKEHDVYNEKAQYEPISVIVGSGNVVKGLDEALKDAKVGEEKEVELEPEEAFGERDPKLVEVYPMKKILSLPEFRKGDKYPVEGMELRMNNRIGFISRIFTGRVWLDFNKRWAGKNLVYKFKIVEQLKDRDEKMKALIENAYPAPDEFRFEFKGDDQVDLILPDMVKLDTSWAMAKFRLVSDLRNHLGLTTVRMIEEYVKQEENEPEPSQEEEKEESSEKGSHDEKEEKKSSDSESSEKGSDDEEKSTEKDS